MTDRPCITHEMQLMHPADRPRACTIRDKHYAACDNEACRGCVPRSARHGLLCDSCWLKGQDALNRAADLILHLRSVESAAAPVGERVDTSRTRRLPVPETWLAADDLLGALGAAPFPSRMSIDAAFDYVDDALRPWRGAELDARVNTIAGASGLVTLIGRMQTALARWPASEVNNRPIPYLLCPECKHQTLERRAPIAYLDSITVTCSSCDYERDWFAWLDLYAPIIANMFDDLDRADGARRRRITHGTPQPRRSEPCAGDEHAACRALTCECGCHYRRYSLYSVRVPFHLLQKATP